MIARRTPRYLRHKCLWISTQSTLYAITALLTCGIFFSEAFIPDTIDSNGHLFSLASRSGNLTQLIQLKEDELQEIPRSSVRMTVHPAIPEMRKPPMGRMTDRARNVSRSSKSKRNLTGQTDMRLRGTMVSVEEFKKKAQAKALEDSVRKRERLLAMKNRRSNNSRDEAKGGLNFHRPHSGFRGVQRNEENAHLFKDDNVTHLSFMLYRLIKTHQIASVLDVPCSASTLWMPELLKILEFEVPGFHYRCIVPDDQYLVEGVLRYKDFSSATIVKDENAWASKLPRADVALVWYGLGYMSPQRAWKLIKALRKSKTKYVVVPNFPDVSHNPGSASKYGHVNVRRAPYRFDEPLRVVNNMSGDPSIRKQLLLYELGGIRSGVL
ncbi:hypothetical protein BWQ96_01778 [Gracilariopsis chorda]|uniref:Uncharacterized protein n=1 Tax=Gracilariopsis chorda TaxID=448386 RepID=A0A2V3J1P9_9FLOR|nr:hypothetical protein BWQ96_01778 [Gracilariopsis chorda]|eukprot:PXF48318.1 hypothetical protein BWQ96_01778 [Gracilariopsis chorda]